MKNEQSNEGYYSQHPYLCYALSICDWPEEECETIESEDMDIDNVLNSDDENEQSDEESNYEENGEDENDNVTDVESHNLYVSDEEN